MPKDARVKTSFVKKLGLSLFSIIVCLAVFGIGEAFCRLFLDINLRKTSREFIVTTDSGKVMANQPNAVGQSFGVEVYTDKYGYRVPKDHAGYNGTGSIVLIGDSVTFGVGVEENETFAGLLRASETKRNVINTGVVGIGLPDYERRLDEALKVAPDTNEVFLFYCLNDFQPAVEDDRRNEPTVSRQLKNSYSSVFQNLNEFFGSRSELYVLLTGLAIDPSRRYYEWDRRLTEVDAATFDETIAPLGRIATDLAGRGIRFTVVVNPYEFQLRPGVDDVAPQTAIIDYLSKQNITVIDTIDAFRTSGVGSRGFLFADPMHLSAAGHKVVFELIRTDSSRQIDAPADR